MRSRKGENVLCFYLKFCKWDLAQQFYLGSANWFQQFYETLVKYQFWKNLGLCHFCLSNLCSSPKETICWAPELHRMIRTNCFFWNNTASTLLLGKAQSCYTQQIKWNRFSLQEYMGSIADELEKPHCWLYSIAGFAFPWKTNVFTVLNNIHNNWNFSTINLRVHGMTVNASGRWL